jgi:hypothetical protein
MSPCVDTVEEPASKPADRTPFCGFRQQVSFAEEISDITAEAPSAPLRVGSEGRRGRQGLADRDAEVPEAIRAIRNGSRVGCS